MFLNRVIVCAILWHVVDYFCANADKCATPNGETAECISIHKCPIILEAIESRDKFIIQFAKKSQCGYDKLPLVCCGTKGNYTQSQSDISKNLLPSRSYCGFQHSDDYVSNVYAEDGSSSISEFPWLAAIFYNVKNTEKHLCVGSLINPRYVLTTAHCINTEPGYKLTKVRLGEYNIVKSNDCVGDENLEECSDPISDFGVEKTIVHEQYSKKYGLPRHDVALIRLNKTAQYSDYIRPICLPLQGAPRANVGDALVQSGWGGRSLDKKNTADIKKKVLSKVIAQEECREKYKSFHYSPTDDHLCTIDVNNTTATCHGDSGGPVMFSSKNQWFQEGIVTFGIGCASGHPDVHGRVANYVDWIVRTIRP